MHNVYLRFHGGRQQWFVEVEKYSLTYSHKGYTAYGTLDQMMQVFTDKTSIELPPVQIIERRLGISTFTKDGVAWDAFNPFHLKAGRHYQVRYANDDREFVVLKRNGRVEIAFADGGEAKEMSFFVHARHEFCNGRLALSVR